MNRQSDNSAEDRIDSSYEYLGSGAYNHLSPVITTKGFDLGWRLTYPEMLNLNGINFSKFTTLDDLVADGIVELRTRTTTLI